MSKRRVSLSIVGAACCLAMLGGGCESKTQKATIKGTKSADSTAVKVVVSAVVQSSFEDWGSYSADLRGVEDAYLTAPYQGGRVGSVKAIGTYVKAGSALCDIDSSKYEAALQAALASVAVASGEMERAKANVEKGSLGRSVLDATNLGYQNARMGYESTNRAYQDCRCEAPFDGILVSKSINRYNTVAPGMPTVRLSRIDKLEATIALPESEAFSYKEGMETHFSLLQNQNKLYKGTLASLDRAVDTRSRTVSARIIVNNSNGALKPGMVGRVQILRKTYASGIVVPSNALMRMQTGVFAMVVENGVAHQRSVVVGATTTDSSLILSGLNANDKLVTVGAFQVSEGTKVTY